MSLLSSDPRLEDTLGVVSLSAVREAGGQFTRVGSDDARNLRRPCGLAIDVQATRKTRKSTSLFLSESSLGGVDGKMRLCSEQSPSSCLVIPSILLLLLPLLNSLSRRSQKVKHY
ncbi:hypothetical protein Peur_014507 [Populus x canadensis]